MRWFEWLTAQILNLSKEFVQDKLDPCVFHCASLDIHWVFHVDDGAATGPLEDNRALLAELGIKVLLKTSAPLHHTHGVRGPLTFLSRGRIWGEAGLSKRPNPKFVDQAAALLGLTAKMEPERALDQEQARLYRSVVCKIMHCQADFISAQFCIKELARDLQQPTDRSMAQLRHLVRYLLGARDLWQVARADRTGDFVTVCVDSNWADGPSRRSTDMVIVKIWDLLLFNSAKTQAFVAQAQRGG